MCFKGGLLKYLVGFVLLYGLWKAGIAVLQRLPIDTAIIRQYLTHPFDSNGKDESLSAAYSVSNMADREHIALGWYVLPTEFALQGSKTETNDANIEERLEETAESWPSSLVKDLEMCRDVLDDVLERTNKTLILQNIKEDLIFCQDSIRRYTEREIGSTYQLPQKRAARAADRESFPPETPFDPRKDTARAMFQKAPHACEETICSVPDLERICTLSSLRLKKNANTVCRMCYPYKDYSLIHAHCRRKRHQEARAFYVLCAVMIAAITVTLVLVCIRDVGRRSRENDRLDTDRRIKKSPIRQRSVSRPSKQVGAISRTSWLSRVPFLRVKRTSTEKSPDITLSDTESSTAKDSIPQQKWDRLGLFSKGARKRVQEVFDLESLKSTKNTQSTITDTTERVPVLPRARRMSVRFPLTEIDSGPSLREFYGENLQPPKDHFATIHTTRPSECGQTITENV